MIEYIRIDKAVDMLITNWNKFTFADDAIQKTIDDLRDLQVSDMIPDTYPEKSGQEQPA